MLREGRVAGAMPLPTGRAASALSTTAGFGEAFTVTPGVWLSSAGAEAWFEDDGISSSLIMIRLFPGRSNDLVGSAASGTGLMIRAPGVEKVLVPGCPFVVLAITGGVGGWNPGGACSKPGEWRQPFQYPGCHSQP